MELTGALEAARARCCTRARHPSTSQSTVPDLGCFSSHRSRVFLCRNGGAFRKNGAAIRSCCASALPCPGGAFLPRRNSLFRARAKPAEVEDEEAPSSDVLKSEAEGEEHKEVEISDEEDFGIDAEGNLSAPLPEEFLELMKDEGPAPNYWLAAFGLTVAFIARKSIWKEFKFWGKILLASGHVAMEAVVLFFQQLIILGGEPLAKVIVFVGFVGLTIRNLLRFTADIVSPLPVLFSVTLSSIILLVGESVSATYTPSEREFPSRRLLDTAALLGLGGFVGVFPVELTLLGIAGITVFLLFVRKVNPVAGFTPAAALFVAIAEPVIRYPVFIAFVGASTYRYWRLGYMSSGAVQKERTAEYPRVLIALLYLAAVSCAARLSFYALSRIRIALAVATG